MDIENEQFFHIKRKESLSNEWEVGNKFHWDSRKNHFIENIYSMDLRFPDTSSRVSYRKAYETLLKLPDVVKEKRLFSYFDFTNFALNKTSMMLREMALENYRRDFCPELPSRSRAIWVCKKDGVEYWKRALQTYNTVTLKLKLNGVMHVASEKSLYSDVLNVYQYMDQAKKYWAKNQSWSQDSEGVFDGEIEILEVI